MKKYIITIVYILFSLGAFAQTGCSTSKLNLNTAPFYYSQCFLDSIYLEKASANKYLYVNSQKKIISVSGYTAGRGLSLGGTIFRLDTSKQYTYPLGLKFGSGYQLNGLTGNVSVNQLYATSDVTATSWFEVAGKSRIYSAADGRFNFTNNNATNFTRLTFGLENTSYPSLQVNGKKLITLLGDGSATTNFQVKDTVFSTVWNSQIDVPTKNAIYDKVITLVSYTDTAIMLSKYLRASDTLKLHNQISARVKYTDTATMLSPYVLESKVYSGSYTPSASDLQNITSISFSNCGNRYMRINNIVTVTGAALITITTSDIFASFELSLPVASTLSSGTYTDIAGVVTGVESPSQGVVLSENNHAQLSWGASGLSAGTYYINYTYSYNIN